MRKIIFVAVLAGWLLPVTVWAQCFPEPSCRVTVPPATQTVADGDTISDLACGTIKNVTAAGAVTTSTTDTFTLPNGSNAGCIMAVCNVGSNTITLDDNTNFDAGGDVSLTAASCVLVGQSGIQWKRLAAVVNN